MSQSLQLVLFLIGGLMICFAILANTQEKLGGSAMIGLGMVVGLWPFLSLSAVLSGLLAGYNFDHGNLLNTAVKQFWSPYLGIWMLVGGLIAIAPQLYHLRRVCQHNRRGDPRVLR